MPFRYFLRTYLILGLLSLLVGCQRYYTFQTGPKASQGLMKISEDSFADRTLIPLNGEWEFVAQNLLTSQKEFEKSQYIKNLKVPGAWNQIMKSSKGYGTYHLNLSLPQDMPELGLLLNGQNCAFSVYINKELIAQGGGVAAQEEEYTADTRPMIIKLPINTSKRVSLLIQVANFHHRNGGIVRPIYMGKYEDIQGYKTNRLVSASFIAGFLFLMALSNLLFFVFNRDKKIYFLFSATTFIFFVRDLAANIELLDMIFFGISYEINIGLEYATFFLMVPFIFHSIIELSADTNKLHKPVIIGAYSIGSIVTLSIFFVHFSIVTQLIPYYQILVLLGLFYIFWMIITSKAKQKRGGRYLIMATLLIVLIAVVHAALLSQLIINTPRIDRMASLVIILMYATFLLQQFAMSLHKSERLNISFKRFMPQEFLHLLEREDITEITLGENIEREMSIFFCDIRSFTSLSENMLPKENFAFINSYLKNVGPLIRKNLGFIDKYIGDAIMGLFPYKAKNAVQTAIDFHHKLVEYNQHRANSGYIPVRIGIGIHTGKLMLGTIGEAERMDTTVISDAVNLASRVESMTKTLGSPALITEDTYESLGDKSLFHLRKMHRLKVKGKERQVFAYEILDCYPSERREKYLKSLKDYNLAMNYYIEGKFNEAKKFFEQVLKTNPEDAATKYYIYSLRQESRKEVSNDD